MKYTDPDGRVTIGAVMQQAAPLVSVAGVAFAADAIAVVGILGTAMLALTSFYPIPKDQYDQMILQSKQENENKSTSADSSGNTLGIINEKRQVRNKEGGAIPPGNQTGGGAVKGSNGGPMKLPEPKGDLGKAAFFTGAGLTLIRKIGDFVKGVIDGTNNKPDSVNLNQNTTPVFTNGDDK